jgi:hypothetical protein
MLMAGEALTSQVSKKRGAAMAKASCNKGLGNAHNKLTEEEVLYIKSLLHGNDDLHVAEVINNDRKAEGKPEVSRQCIRHIRTGASWGWLTHITKGITFKENSDG